MILSDLQRVTQIVLQVLNFKTICVNLKIPFVVFWVKAKLQKEGNFFPHPFICQRHFSNEKSWKSKKLRPPSPNVSTTPITAMGRRQCLPLSII